MKTINFFWISIFLVLISIYSVFAVDLSTDFNPYVMSYWPLKHNLSDSGPSGIDLTNVSVELINNATCPGPNGCMYTGGTNDARAWALQTVYPSGDSNGTVACFVKNFDFSTNYAFIVQGVYPASSSVSFAKQRYIITDANKYAGGSLGGGGSQSIDMTNVGAAGEIMHISLRVNPSLISIQDDGILNNSAAETGFNTVNNFISIGAQYYGGWIQEAKAGISDCFVLNATPSDAVLIAVVANNSAGYDYPDWTPSGPTPPSGPFCNYTYSANINNTVLNCSQFLVSNNSNVFFLNTTLNYEKIAVESGSKIFINFNSRLTGG